MPALRSLFIVVLFLLNLVALAAIFISIGQPRPKGEPERITNQINPDRIALQTAEISSRTVERIPSRAGRPAGEIAQSVEAAIPAWRAPAESPLLAARPAAQVEDLEPATPAEPHAPVASAPAETPVPQACVLYGQLSQEQADALTSSARNLSAELRTEHDTATVTTAWWVRLPAMASREAADRRVRELRDAGIRDYFVFRDGGSNQFAVSLGLFSSEGGARQHLAFLDRKRIAGAQIVPRSSTIHRLQVSGPATILEALSAQFEARHAGVPSASCNP